MLHDAVVAVVFVGILVLPVLIASACSRASTAEDDV